MPTELLPVIALVAVALAISFAVAWLKSRQSKDKAG